jgi:hypothetical protein
MKTVTEEQVRALFTHLESGNADAFFQHVADDVDRTVMGTRPLAGTYHSKQEFIAHTFKRLNTVLKDGAAAGDAYPCLRHYLSGRARSLVHCTQWSPVPQPVLLDLPVRSRADCGSPGVPGFCARAETSG